MDMEIIMHPKGGINEVCVHGTCVPAGIRVISQEPRELQQHIDNVMFEDRDIENLIESTQVTPCRKQPRAMRLY
jgi:hypothetical protein